MNTEQELNKAMAEANNAAVKLVATYLAPAGTILINVNGTAGKSPKCPNCGPWINHWHILSDKEIPDDGDCSIKDCDGLTEKKDGKPRRKQVIEGCHVKIKGEDGVVYIAPLCHGCNLSPDGTELTLKRSTILVKANVRESCGKLINENR